VDAVPSIACTEVPGRREKLHVLAVRTQLVEHHSQVHVVLIDREVELAAEPARQLDRLVERFRHE
jgi:hypothetical protein